jgi:uncharacterized protein YgiM (DUF1202 family)
MWFRPHSLFPIAIILTLSLSAFPQKLAVAQQWCSVGQYDGQYGLSADSSSAADLDGDGTITRGDWMICVQMATEYLSACGFTTETEALTLPCHYYQNLPSENSSNAPPEAAVPGVDMINFCRSNGFDNINIVPTSRSASGLQCVRNSDGALQNVDMNALCQWQFGQGYIAVRTNPDDPYGWNCTLSTSPDGTLGGPVPVDSGSSSPIGDRSVRVFASPSLNIRSNPGTSNPVIGRAGYNGYFEVIAEPENGWYKIRFNDGEGWVISEYVEVYYDGNSRPNHLSCRSRDVIPIDLGWQHLDFQWFLLVPWSAYSEGDATRVSIFFYDHQVYPQNGPFGARLSYWGHYDWDNCEWHRYGIDTGWILSRLRLSDWQDAVNWRVEM